MPPIAILMLQPFKSIVSLSKDEQKSVAKSFMISGTFHDLLTYFVNSISLLWSFSPTASRTMPPIDRQVIFYITLGFSLVLNSVHVYKSRSSIREIIPNAHFEKNQFFTKMKVVVDFWAFWLLGGQRFDNSSLTIEARTTGACSSKRACFSDYETPIVF